MTDETSNETASRKRPHSGVDPRLLEILICPQTRQPLQYDAERDELVSPKAKIAYPIRGGIPIMLPEEARDIDGDGE
ncbi:MAG TPA: Trm112 family protein [Hyphomonas sp.]|nr:Trm112 family protein [Hyphomonas sp.]